MTDPAGDRPARPQYGEYATPEEQRARIKVPDPALLPETPAAPEAAHQSATPAPSTPAPADPSRRPGRIVDRIATWGLLAYGLINVVSSVPALLDYGAYAAMMLDLLGVDARLADPAAGQPWGTAAAAVLAIGWILIAMLSWRNLRAGRITFWIPLVGGVVCNLASGMLVLIPLMQDAAVWSAMVGALG